MSSRITKPWWELSAGAQIPGPPASNASCCSSPKFSPSIHHITGQFNILAQPPPQQPMDGCSGTCCGPSKAVMGLTEIQRPPPGPRSSLPPSVWVRCQQWQPARHPPLHHRWTLWCWRRHSFLPRLTAGAFFFFAQGVYHSDAGHIYNGRHIRRFPPTHSSCLLLSHF